MNAQLQELYLHLEHTLNGNTYLAWYAQLRAVEKTHAEALEETIVKYRLRDQRWYQLRMERKEREQNGRAIA